DRVGHRLLDVDVLAGLHRLDGHLLVPVVRRGHDHGVDVLAGADVLVVRVDLRLAARAGPGALQSAGVAIRQRGYLYPGDPLRRLEQFLAPRAAADQAESDTVA